jgi:hypothetical protein
MPNTALAENKKKHEKSSLESLTLEQEECNATSEHFDQNANRRLNVRK